MNFLKKTILGFSTLCFFFPLWADDCPQLWGRFVCISDNFDKEPSYVLKIVQTGHGSQTTYVFNRPKTQTSWTHKVDERRLGRTYGGVTMTNSSICSEGTLIITKEFHIKGGKTSMTMYRMEEENRVLSITYSSNTSSSNEPQNAERNTRCFRDSLSSTQGKK